MNTNDKLSDWVFVPRTITPEMESVYQNEHCVFQTAQEIHDALIAAAPAPAVGSPKVWRPIKSAPRNGCGILALLPDSNFAVGIWYRDGAWRVAWNGERLGEDDQPEYWMHSPDVNATHSPALTGDAMDAERLMYAFQADGFFGVEKDRYDYAIDCATENGRDEPNQDDELNGVRRVIDAAIAAQAAKGGGL